MKSGRIVKALSGYYYVEPEEHEAQQETGETIQCRARGVFKLRGISPLVGDRIQYELTDNGEGTVVEILPRSSELIRPPVANVDVAVLVFALQEPALSFQLLDKFLVHTESAGLDAVICITKCDLASEASGESGAAQLLADTERIYGALGYSVIQTSSKRQEGIQSVAQQLKDRVSVFAGQSGVGKSSLLNAIVPGLQLQTNEISMKLGRGKHTTRHVELVKLPGGGLAADTPGFSQLDFLQVEAEGLSDCFIEFRSYAEKCRFRGCLHLHEPDCSVRAASEQGEIAASRYDHYIQFLLEIKEKKRRY